MDEKSYKKVLTGCIEGKDVIRLSQYEVLEDKRKLPDTNFANTAAYLRTCRRERVKHGNRAGESQVLSEGSYRSESENSEASTQPLLSKKRKKSKLHTPRKMTHNEEVTIDGKTSSLLSVCKERIMPYEQSNDKVSTNIRHPQVWLHLAKQISKTVQGVLFVSTLPCRVAFASFT